MHRLATSVVCQSVVGGWRGGKISTVRGVTGGRGKESNNFVNFFFLSSYSYSLITFIFITVSLTSKWNRKVLAVLIRVVYTLQKV